MGAPKGGYVDGLKRGSVILRSQNRRLAIAGVARSGQHIESTGIVWVESNAFNAVQSYVILGNPVQQREPYLLIAVPTVDSAHIGSGIKESLYFRGRDDPVNESSTVEPHIAPTNRVVGVVVGTTS
jgi:hypothetical protein